MKYLAFLLFIVFMGCHHVDEQKLKKLNDSIAVLRKNYDFRPLNQDDAYQLINTCYLKRLDTMPGGRKLLIFPLKGTDFKYLFKRNKEMLIAEYNGDTTLLKKLQADLRWPGASLDTSFKWKSERLVHTTVVEDSIMIKLNNDPAKNRQHFDRAAWIKKYPGGYGLISYPLYNAQKGIAVISEWSLSGPVCTDPQSTLSFKRVPGGWQSNN